MRGRHHHTTTRFPKWRCFQDKQFNRALRIGLWSLFLQWIKVTVFSCCMQVLYLQTIRNTCIYLSSFFYATLYFTTIQTDLLYFSLHLFNSYSHLTLRYQKYELIHLNTSTHDTLCEQDAYPLSKSHWFSVWSILNDLVWWLYPVNITHTIIIA